MPDAFVAKRFGPVAWMLVKPLTFMNRSGEVAAGVSRYYDVPFTDLLVVVDDVDLRFGRLRARASRLRRHPQRPQVDRRTAWDEGVSPAAAGSGARGRKTRSANHVLSTFESGERAELDLFIARAADAAEMFAVDSISTVMNTYNPDATGPDVD